MAPPSETLDCRERVERVEAEDVEGVDTERSSSGTASRAREGETLGDGELGRWRGEVTVLEEVSAMVALIEVYVARPDRLMPVICTPIPRAADVRVDSTGVSRCSHTACMTTVPWCSCHGFSVIPRKGRHQYRSIDQPIPDDGS